MTPGRLLAAEGVAAGSLLAAALVQRLSGGIQLELLILGALLLPAHLGRLLAWRGLAPAPPWWTLLCELGAVTLVRTQDVPPLALDLGLLGGLLPGLHADADDVRGARATRVGASLAALLAVGSLVHAWWVARPLALARLVLLVAPLAELVRPADRTALAELRRGGGLLALGTLCLVRVQQPESELFASLVVALVAGGALWLHATPAAERRRSWRRVQLRLLAPLVIAGAALLAGELVFRLVPTRYSGLLSPERAGQSHVPGAALVHRGQALSPQLEPENEVRWNRHGWHDAEHDLNRAPGVLRILVLGDSYVEGVQVPLEALYHRRLARELEARGGTQVETIAYGWSGWGQRQELVALRDGQPDPTRVPSYPPGLAFDPDLVLVEFLAGNDVRNNLPALDELALREQVAGTFARALFVSSVRRGWAFSAMVWDKTDQLLRQLTGRTEWLDAEVYREAPRREPELWSRAWEETRAALGAMRALLEPRGVGLVVVGFSTPEEIEGARTGRAPGPGLDMLLPHRRMAALCEELGLPYLPLPERFARLPGEEQTALHGQGDPHWTEFGHRRAAETTAAFVLETPPWARARERAARPRAQGPR